MTERETSGQPDDLLLARTVSEAVLEVEGIYSLGSGRYVEAATYGPGQKVVGVVVGDGEVRVHVVVSWPLPEPIPALAESVRELVALRSGGRAATVVVEDLEVVGDPAARPGGDVDVDL